MKPAVRRTVCFRLLNILFFLALLIFVVIAVFVHVYPDNVFDQYIQESLQPLATQSALPYWICLSFFGSFEFLFPAYVIIIGISIWQSVYSNENLIRRIFKNVSFYHSKNI